MASRTSEGRDGGARHDPCHTCRGRAASCQENSYADSRGYTQVYADGPGGLLSNWFDARDLQTHRPKSEASTGAARRLEKVIHLFEESDAQAGQNRERAADGCLRQFVQPHGICVNPRVSACIGVEICSTLNPQTVAKRLTHDRTCTGPFPPTGGMTGSLPPGCPGGWNDTVRLHAARGSDKRDCPDCAIPTN